MYIDILHHKYANTGEVRASKTPDCDVPSLKARTALDQIMKGCLPSSGSSCYHVKVIAWS